MILYGTEVSSDIGFPLDFTHETEVRHEVNLSSGPPDALRSAITCGVPLYWAHGRKVYLYSDRPFEGSESGQPWCYEVEDLLRFYWVSGEELIYYELGTECDAALLGFWFTHLMLPFYLALEGRYDFMHAGAVEIDGKPVLFLAPSTGGKSTMTDYFIRRGHVLLSDDKVPILAEGGRYLAGGSHPYHRPYRKFEDLGYRVEKFSAGFKPIHAFYLLERAYAEEAVEIEEVRGFEKFHGLLPHYLFRFFSWKQQERLHTLTGMINAIRVFRVRVPWDMARLGEVHDVICGHSKEA
jgi:hypothetical protein